MPDPPTMDSNHISQVPRRSGALQYARRNALAVAVLCAQWGAASGHPISPAKIWSQADITGLANQNSDRFGQAVATGDFNNDGFDDLAIGIPNERADFESDSGAVVVLYGSADGLQSAGADVLTQASIIDSESEEGDLFGWSLCTGNFNGDDFDDLAIGTPCEDTGGATDTGMVAVVYGSATGLSTETESISQASLADSLNEDSDNFGWSLAAGDVDGDGFDELIVGIPLEDFGAAIDTGAIGVFFGTENGLLDGTSAPLSQSSLFQSVNESGDQMGYSVTSGDFDGDGYADVAVGIPFEDIDEQGDTDAGMVGVLYGSEMGFDEDKVETFSQFSLVDAQNEDDDLFAWAIAAGDYDGDGTDDLAVGIPSEDFGVRRDAGLIGVFLGSDDGLFPTDSESFAQTTAGGEHDRDDAAGQAIASGDFDGDGHDDLLIGVPFQNTDTVADAGALMLYFGSDEGMLPARAFFLTASAFGGTEDNSDEFGSVVGSGDFNGDGLDEMVIGVPSDNFGTDLDAGSVYVGSLGDGDGDGLVDTFEEVLGTDPTRADTDNDGVTDGAEIEAGTDPLEPRSRLAITDILYDDFFGEVTITWASTPGRNYEVEWSADLSGRWRKLTGGLPVPASNGATTSFTDTTIGGSTRMRYYRVVLLQ